MDSVERLALILACLLAFAMVGGCGPAVSAVSGTVTVDGQPVASGVISYVPAEGGGEPATATIAAGRYELQTSPGKKFVQISAPVVVGKRKEYEGADAPLVEITDESLPPHYNSQTELSFDVQRGKNTKDWSLTKGKK
jgi:hypothetical protein